MLRFLLNWSESKHFEFKYPSDLGVMLGNYSVTSRYFCELLTRDHSYSASNKEAYVVDMQF